MESRGETLLEFHYTDEQIQTGKVNKVTGLGGVGLCPSRSAPSPSLSSLSRALGACKGDEGYENENNNSVVMIIPANVKLESTSGRPFTSY